MDPFPTDHRCGETGADKGTSFGIPNPLEVEMAKLVKTAVSSITKSACAIPARRRRCQRSGSRAGSRIGTKILKFEGCYHGHVDSLLVKAGSAR
jgi:glutamate-1-semialdehyde 2,1-aminomutase